MPEWFLSRHLGVSATPEERRMLDRQFDVLVRSALEQPASFVHRDYHSRNLLVTPEANPGILDFQDALRGPVTYDPVSLLKDCYIEWPRERVTGWLRGYRQRLSSAGLEIPVDEPGFIRWFDLMGLQRHIKVLGIFARLFYRDGKSGYLNDLPRVLAYTRDAASRYRETAELAAFIAARIDPAFETAQAKAFALAGLAAPGAASASA
jgi:aminoglycoside/choline kinase family phosphotransferase